MQHQAPSWPHRSHYCPLHCIGMAGVVADRGQGIALCHGHVVGYTVLINQSSAELKGHMHAKYVLQNQAGQMYVVNAANEPTSVTAIFAKRVGSLFDGKRFLSQAGQSAAFLSDFECKYDIKYVDHHDPQDDTVSQLQVKVCRSELVHGGAQVWWLLGDIQEHLCLARIAVFTVM